MYITFTYRCNHYDNSKRFSFLYYYFFIMNYIVIIEHINTEISEYGTRNTHMKEGSVMPSQLKFKIKFCNPLKLFGAAAGSLDNIQMVIVF